MESPAVLGEAERQQRLSEWSASSGVNLALLDSDQRAVTTSPLPCYVLPAAGAAWAGVCLQQAARSAHRPGAQPGGSRPRPSSAPRLLPSPSTRPPSLLYARLVNWLKPLCF
jgi:hypothetical protein